LPAGTKLLGVTSSRNEIAAAVRSLRLVRRVKKAGRECLHHMSVSDSDFAFIAIHFASDVRCGGFVFSHSEGNLYEHFILFRHQRRSLETMAQLMDEVLAGFAYTLFLELMDQEERRTFCNNMMILLLPPEELERWADAEQQEQDAKAQITTLQEKVRTRDLSTLRDKENPALERVLNKLPAEDREFARLCYPEELQQYFAALSCIGEALMTKTDLMQIAAARVPE